MQNALESKHEGFLKTHKKYAFLDFLALDNKTGKGFSEK
jgi:hypothetical protein